MASSEVEICNIALARIRGGSINSLGEASVQAQNCKLLYPNMRDLALSAAPWGFNRKIDTLSLRTDTVFGWAYLYQYPSDAIRINKLILNYSTVSAGTGVYRERLVDDLFPPDLEKQVEYKVVTVAGQKVIASNYPELRIDYGVKVTDVNLFSIELDMAIALILGSYLAIPIAGVEAGRAFRDDLREEYEIALADAIASSQNDGYTPRPDSEFVMAKQ